MIELPSTPQPNSATPALLTFGGILRPPLGGKLLKLDRMGDRFRIDVSYPPLDTDTGRIFVSRLLQGKREGIRLPYPLLSVDQGSPGSPRVNGAGQSGRTIDLDGFNPGYVAREGFWLSIVNAAGQHYLHNVRADTTANGSGVMTDLPIEPMLRVAFADNAVVNFAVPMIEGLVLGEEAEWQMSLAHHIGISFAIEEAE
jgi:hypothetical protein